MTSYIRGGTAKLTAQFLASVGGNPTDPTSITLRVVTDSTLVAGPVIYPGVIVRDLVGLYHYPWAVPAELPLGAYTAEWTAIIDGATRTGYELFTVIDGGVVDPGPHPVLSVADAKIYLNKLGAVTVDDDELAGFIPPAVERVDRHLFSEAERDAGRTLATEPVVTATQVLAVKMVLAEFWRTQRTRLGSRGGGFGASGTAIEADSGPAGAAPLTVRLTDLLGPPADSGSGGVPAPSGSFPPASPWPDPACIAARWGAW